ncbi:MAG: hypothetical protein ACLTSZ_01145 [Lachnospiraceae bacterium]
MHKWHIAVSVGMALVIFFGFRYDVLGYNTFLPAQDEVASMAVRSLFTAWSYPVQEKANRNDEQLALDYLENTANVDLLYPHWQKSECGKSAEASRKIQEELSGRYRVG